MLHAYQVITKMILLGLSKMLTLRVLNLGNYESYDETLVTIRPAFGDYINYGIILLYIKIFFLRGNYNMLLILQIKPFFLDPQALCA